MLSNTFKPGYAARDPRSGLVLLHDGPWLDDTRPTRSCRRQAIAGTISCLGCLLLANAPGAAPGVWIALGLAGGMVAFCGAARYGTAHWTRLERQTCPECLRWMTRGATTCPHCHFRPQQGHTGAS